MRNLSPNPAADVPSSAAEPLPEAAEAAPRVPLLRRLSALDATRTDETPRRRNRPRGLPAALAGHEIFRHSDPISTVRAGREFFGEHHVVVDERDLDHFEGVMHAARLRDITVAFLDHGAPSTIRMLRPTGDHLIVIPASGSAELRVDGAEHTLTPIAAAVLPAGDRSELRSSAPTPYVIVRIEAGALERHVARLLGRAPERTTRFEPVFDLAASSATRWNTGLQLLLAELLDPDSLLRTNRDVGQIESFLMSALLLGHASNRSDLFSAGSSQRRVVRNACDFIERNLTVQLTVADIADAVGVGIRTLQNHFADDLGQSPMSYLRDARLDRVHAELADLSTSAGARVTDVAMRWGFGHLGRFSAAYRSRFGESPSQTLRG